MSPLVLCMIHCPRTAGATTIIYLRHHGHFSSDFIEFPEPRFLELGSETCGPGEEWKESFSKTFPEEITRPIFCAGHFPYGLNDHLKYPNFHYFSIVRDPVQRVWSRYNAYLNAPNYELHKAWQERYNFSIIKIMEAGEVELCNDQTRLISGTNTVKIRSDDLIHALYLVDNAYDYVTVTERAPEHLLNELHQLFPEVKPGTMTTRYNQIGFESVGGDVPSPRIRDAILEYNQHDLTLYNYVARHGKTGITFNN